MVVLLISCLIITRFTSNYIFYITIMFLPFPIQLFSSSSGLINSCILFPLNMSSRVIPTSYRSFSTSVNQGPLVFLHRKQAKIYLVNFFWAHILSYKSVSYTHLDVYKRQQQQVYIQNILLNFSSFLY